MPSSRMFILYSLSFIPQVFLVKWPSNEFHFRNQAVVLRSCSNGLENECCQHVHFCLPIEEISFNLELITFKSYRVLKLTLFLFKKIFERLLRYMIGNYNVIIHRLCIFQGHKHFLFPTSCEIIDIINYYLYKNGFKSETRRGLVVFFGSQN